MVPLPGTQSRRRGGGGRRRLPGERMRAEDSALICSADLQLQTQSMSPPKAKRLQEPSQGLGELQEPLQAAAELLTAGRLTLQKAHLLSPHAPALPAWLEEGKKCHSPAA